MAVGAPDDPDPLADNDGSALACRTPKRQRCGRADPAACDEFKADIHALFAAYPESWWEHAMLLAPRTLKTPATYDELLRTAKALVPPEHHAKLDAIGTIRPDLLGELRETLPEWLRSLPNFAIPESAYDPELTVDRPGPPEPWWGFKCRKTGERRTIHKREAPADPRTPEGLLACWRIATPVPSK